MGEGRRTIGEAAVEMVPNDVRENRGEIVEDLTFLYFQVHVFALLLAIEQQRMVSPFWDTMKSLL